MKCNVAGCESKYYGRGYCQKHYRKYIYVPTHKTQIKKNNKKWKEKIKLLRPKKHRCAADNCENNCIVNNKYCSAHRLRLKKGFDMDLSKKCYRKGEGHQWWRGGKSQYPNHYQFKKNRLIVLTIANHKCAICSRAAEHVHHIDGGKNNHSIDNLRALCAKCHAKYF